MWPWLSACIEVCWSCLACPMDTCTLCIILHSMSGPPRPHTQAQTILLGDSVPGDSARFSGFGPWVVSVKCFRWITWWNSKWNYYMCFYFAQWLSGISSSFWVLISILCGIRFHGYTPKKSWLLSSIHSAYFCGRLLGLTKPTMHNLPIFGFQLNFKSWKKEICITLKWKEHLTFTVPFWTSIFPLMTKDSTMKSLIKHIKCL